MARLVVPLLVLCLGAAITGAVVPGLFPLTLVAIGGLLLVGGTGVGTYLARHREPAAPAEQPARLRLVTSAAVPVAPVASAPASRAGVRSRAGGGVPRAA
ncbi:hypothetical protein ACI784_22155 [Geodermatophilus sp. SYSU D01186]